MIGITISTISFVLYIGMIIYRYGILPSISDSWYMLPKGQKWLFTAFLWTFSFPIMICSNTALLFSAGSFICLIGVNVKFREATESFMHSLSAYVGISLGMLSLIINFGLYATVIFFTLIVFLIEALNIKNKFWWIEILAISIILISLFKVL